MGRIPQCQSALRGFFMFLSKIVYYGRVKRYGFLLQHFFDAISYFSPTHVSKPFKASSISALVALFYFFILKI